MSTVQHIKVLQAQGWLVSAIAAALAIDRKTARKYLQQTNFSEPAPAGGVRLAKLDAYKETN
jgi:transposase